MAKSNQVIFLEGKQKALETLFSSDNFGYLAIGYDPEAAGFEDVGSTLVEKGFKEIELENETSYRRLELNFKNAETDPDTGKVLVTFTADLPTGVISGHNINQMAVVDSQNISGTTKIYSATLFPTFNKTSTTSMTFVIGFRL